MVWHTRGRWSAVGLASLAGGGGIVGLGPGVFVVAFVPGGDGRRGPSRTGPSPKRRMIVDGCAGVLMIGACP